jgi:hypothetical protein
MLPAGIRIPAAMQTTNIIDARIIWGFRLIRLGSG